MIQLLEIIAISSLGIWLVYGLVSLTGLALYNTIQGAEKPASVIVYAHNELEHLKKLIPELLKQAHTNFEIIIINDRSDDGTYDFLLDIKSAKVKLVKVDKVHDHINTKKYAMTLGVKAAKHDILVFIDVDCRPATRNWLSNMSKAFSDDTQFVLGVSQYDCKKGFWVAFIRFDALTNAINYLGFAIAGNPYMGTGSNMAYRKSSFLEKKGFNKIQHIPEGDDELLVNLHANKRNTKVILDRETLTHRIANTTWNAYRCQKNRHCFVRKFYRLKDKILLGFQNFANLIFWLSLVTLSIQTDDYLIPAGLLSFRIFFLLMLDETASRKTGVRASLWLVPIMDILYVMCTSIFSIISLFTKKVRWKR